MNDLDSVLIVGGSPDVHSWTPSAKITSIEFRPDNFLIHFDAEDRWPNVIYPGWTGPLQFTLWVILSNAGQWFTTGCIQFWKGREGVGGPFSKGAEDWWFRCKEMKTVQPRAGDEVGFMVTAGNQRLRDQHEIAERSKAVYLTIPTLDTGLFTNFNSAAPSPPFIFPTPNPTPNPTTDNQQDIFKSIDNRLRQLNLMISNGLHIPLPD